MTQLKLDPTTHDLAVENGGFTDVSGIDEIAQHVRDRLMTFRGELVLATDVGVPWIQEVMEKGTAPERLESIYREIILGTIGVEQLLSGPTLALDAATRHLTCTFRADTDEGLLNFSQVVTQQPLQEVE